MRRTLYQNRIKDNRPEKAKRVLPLLMAFSLGITLNLPTAHADPSLPVLTDATSSTISLQEEHRLGRNWARVLRGQAALLDDPVVKQYLNDLLWQVVEHSELMDRRLELVVLDKESFNAFAVPGGIVGIHGGLLLASESEAELASVVAHELAHLSQRHYAQQLEESRRNRPLMLAGLLAGILVAAADSQAGTAAITSTIAGSAQAQLAFSRRNEQEADRIGMQTLSASGYDPYAMPKMFERLQNSYRFYGQKPPEFLLTHPVTESRIADSLNRAATLPRPPVNGDDMLYDLVRTRLQVHYSKEPQTLYSTYSEQASDGGSGTARYGQMISALAAGRTQQSREAFESLPSQWRDHLYVRLSELDLLLAEGAQNQAFNRVEALLDLYPDSMPVRYRYALIARQTGRIKLAAQVLNELVRDYPNDVDFWYQLAETEGLNGRIYAVHMARIEYFMLTAQLDLALRQVEFARRENGLNDIEKARLNQKELEIKTLRQQMKDDLS
ncbi:M48 family metalloprotease [Marinobacterium litorale]|uniref:M48 family metalloprotease n=1 Tax=Marinobacterium litorale TaxID=404770 RepID=UPI0004150104|nr:M48 family metalloprotease [Marinobacterium litorale]